MPRRQYERGLSPSSAAPHRPPSSSPSSCTSTCSGRRAYTPANYGPAQRTATAAASRQQQRGDSRLGSNAAQQLALGRVARIFFSNLGGGRFHRKFHAIWAGFSVSIKLTELGEISRFYPPASLTQIRTWRSARRRGLGADRRCAARGELVCKLVALQAEP